jgi:hypothetical protein
VIFRRAATIGIDLQLAARRRAQYARLFRQFDAFGDPCMLERLAWTR